MLLSVSFYKIQKKRKKPAETGCKNGFQLQYYGGFFQTQRKKIKKFLSNTTKKGYENADFLLFSEGQFSGKSELPVHNWIWMPVRFGETVAIRYGTMPNPSCFQKMFSPEAAKRGVKQQLFFNIVGGILRKAKKSRTRQNRGLKLPISFNIVKGFLRKR